MSQHKGVNSVIMQNIFYVNSVLVTAGQYHYM